MANRPLPPSFLLSALALIAVLALAATGCAPPIRVPDADLAITDVTVIDGRGGPPLAAQTVLIVEDRIASVAPAERTEVPEGARVVDGSGRFLIPGLWDLHVHAWSPRPFAEIFLRQGITAVREMGTGIEPLWGGSAGVWDWREAARAGELESPRVFAPGFILNGGEPDQQGAVFFKAAPDAQTAIGWVDTLADRDADFIKVYSALSPEAYAAIAGRARERGLTFAGHVPSRVGTRGAIAAGQSSLEHFYDFLVAASGDEEAIRAEIEEEMLVSDMQTAAAQAAEHARTDRLLASFDPARARELYALLRDSGTWISPTLGVNADPRCPDGALPAASEEDLATLPAYLHRFVELPETAPEELARDCRRFAKLSEITAEMAREGVPLLAGSDAPNPGVLPGVGLHEELALLVGAGLEPGRVLEIATRDAAEFMGLGESLGTIEVGKIADLVLLDADPLEEIRNSRRISAVIVGGRVMGESGDEEPTSGL